MSPDRARADGSRSDAAVIARSLDDPARFAELFDRHHDAMWRFVRSRVGDRAVADDLAAELFRIAFEQRHDFDLGYDSAKPWLFGIAANLVREHHRRRARREDLRDRAARDPSHGGGEPEAGAGDPEGRLARLAEHVPVARALRQLPERDREPLLLYAWDDLSYDEVARVLEIPVGTVRSRIHRAREQVRDHLDDDTEISAQGGDER